MQATITSKGQLTLPKSIRDQLRLKAGDRLEFFLRPDGHIEAVAMGSALAALKGMIPPPRKGVSLEEMDDAIRKGATGE